MKHLSRRRFLAVSGTSASLALCGCFAGPCVRPTLAPGVAWAGQMTFGETRRCVQESSSDLHGVPVELPADAPSIVSDFRTALDVNFDVRPFRHTGIDIAGREGVTPVIAAMDGVVDDARSYFSGGKSVTVFHGQDRRGNDIVSISIHLSHILVSAGTAVSRGDILGLVGMTGTTSGSVPHLHFGLFAARGIRGGAYGHYFYSAYVNPHHYWHDGAGRVTMFEPGRTYPKSLGTTYPVPRRSHLADFEARAAAMPRLQ